MANYAIRVELRGYPTQEQYQTLHALMNGMGFRQTINGVDPKGNQRTFDLPHAMYYGSSTSTCGAVRDTVCQAVRAQVQNEILVFVVDANTWALG